MLWYTYLTRQVNKQVTLIFPHQLFKVHPAIEEGCYVYMVEDHLYFR